MLFVPLKKTVWKTVEARCGQLQAEVAQLKAKNKELEEAHKRHKKTSKHWISFRNIDFDIHKALRKTLVVHICFWVPKKTN